MFDIIPNVIVAWRVVFYPNYFKSVYKKFYIDTSIKRKTTVLFKMILLTLH